MRLETLLCGGIVMPAAQNIGELLSKIISRQVRSSGVKKDQQRDVEKIEEMLVYYRGNSPALKRLSKRADESGLKDSSEYVQFSELRGEYLDTIDELKEKEDAVSADSFADLIEEISAVYKPLHRAEKRFEDAAYKAFEAKKAERDARPTKGELLTAIIENKVPDEIAENNAEVIAEIQEVLKPYIHEDGYLKDIADKMKSVELSEQVDEKKQFDEAWDQYVGVVQAYSSDPSGKDAPVDATLNELKDDVNEYYSEMIAAETALNEKMKKTLLENYKLAGDALEVYNKLYEERLGVLNGEMDKIRELEAGLKHRQNEIEALTKKLEKLKEGTPKYSVLYAELQNKRTLHKQLYDKYKSKKDELEKDYLEFTQGKTTKQDEARITKFVDQREYGSDVEVDATEVVARVKEYTKKSIPDVLKEHEQKFKHFQSLLIKFGVTREAEVMSLTKELEQAKKDIDKLAEEGRKAEAAYNALKNTPRSLKDILTGKAYREKKAAKQKLDEKIAAVQRAKQRAADIHRNLIDPSTGPADYNKRSVAEQKKFQEAVDAEKAKAAEALEKKRTARQEMSPKERAIADKEESSSNAKKTLAMCKRNIPILKDIIKNNPNGLPYIGQKFDVIRSFRKGGKLNKEGCETWYDNKDINYLLSLVDQLAGKNGIIMEIANDPSTTKESRGNSFVSFKDNVCGQWAMVKHSIYDAAFTKKLMDESESAGKGNESEQKKLEDTVSAFVKLAKNVQAGVEGVEQRMKDQLSGGGKISKLKNKVKSFFGGGDKNSARAKAQTASLLEDCGADLDDTAREFWQAVADFERAGVGPNSWQKKLKGYSKLAKAGYDWLFVVSSFVPLGGSVLKALGLIVTSLNLGLNVSKKIGFNYAWDQDIVNAQDKLSKSCSKLVDEFGKATQIYKKAIADGSGNDALAEQYAVEKALSRIVGYVNSMLLEFSVSCEQEAKKYYQPPFNAHVHEYKRLLYAAKSLVKELMMNLFDAQGYANLPEELKG